MQNSSNKDNLRQKKIERHVRDEKMSVGQRGDTVTHPLCGT